MNIEHVDLDDFDFDACYKEIMPFAGVRLDHLRNSVYKYVKSTYGKDHVMLTQVPKIVIILKKLI